MRPLQLDKHRFYPDDPAVRGLAADLFARGEPLPIISPHGHTDPAWFAEDEPFTDATSLFLWPDHYVLRMLNSQGIGLEAMGIGPGGQATADRRAVWKLFAANYHLFRGTPSRLWLDHAFVEVVGLD